MRTFRPFPRAVPLLAALLLVLTASAAFARPAIRKNFFLVYPGAVGSRLDNLPSHATHCGVCHYDFNGGGTRNPYGAAVEAARATMADTLAIRTIQNNDSDADGYSNWIEIVTNLAQYPNTPTFPGLTSGNVGSTTNVPNLSEITPYLTPVPAGDFQAPVVNVLAPNGGEAWVGGTVHAVAWSATDNVGVTSVDVYYKDGASQPWTKIAQGLTNSGSFSWFVHDTPTNASKVRVVARDLVGNVGQDSSNAVFTIVATPGGIAPTTLRDFKQPGTQPFEGGTFQDHSSCIGCHGGYDPAVEPGFNAMGSMMMQAAHDPLFSACLAVANQDAPGSGDLCLRCHTPFGWMSGRSQPTTGDQLTALDRDGVACDFCHRAVDPIYQAGVSPPEDQAVLAMIAGHVPSGYANGQYVVDPNQVKRGPYTDPVAPHAFVASAFHRSSNFCGTCHDVSNPVFNRVSGADYAPGPLDAPATTINSQTLLPLERTFSEWSNSSYPFGVYAPEFAGNNPGGIVSSCQDCHMRSVTGVGCNDPAAPTRTDLPLHDLMGGNAWMPAVSAALYPTETDPAALAAGAARAVAMLQKAAGLDLVVNAEGDSMRALVTVTNHTGHKLPTGYPEGRRVWIQVIARDLAGNVVFQSGAYDAATGVLTHDALARVYECELGISPALAAALNAGPGGPSFHFALNDTLYKDNRIPPQGFTNTGFDAFGGAPVDHTWPGPGPRYADGQNYDIASYPIPHAARTVVARLWYQTTSKEYVEFLDAQNTTNAAGQIMYDAWVAHGRAAPVLMIADSAQVGPTGVPDVPAGVALGLRPLANPARGPVELALSLPSRCDVTWEVYDAGGRRVADGRMGERAAGAHTVRWDGRGPAGDAGAGLFWVRVRAGTRTLTQQVVRLGR